MMHKHTQNWSEASSPGERRFCWRNGPRENLPEATQREIERIVSGVPQDQQEATRNRLTSLLGQTQQSPERQRSPETGGEQPPAGTRVQIPRDPQQARQELEQLAEQYREVHGSDFVDRGPVGPNMLRSAAVAGGSTFVPAYLAWLAHNGVAAPALLGNAGAAVLGWHLGKKYAPNHPTKGKYLGAAVGVVSPPALIWGMKNLSDIIASNLTTATTGLFGGVTGLAVYKTLRTPLNHGPQWLRKERGIITSGACATGSALLAGTLANMAWLNAPAQAAASGFGAFLKGAADALAFISPTAGEAIASLPLTSGTAALAALAGTGLYGLGRIDSWMWGKKKAGLLKNMLVRGPLGLVSLPYGALIHYPIKYLLGNAKKGLGNNIEAVKNIFTGKSPAVKAVSSPIWWPLKTAGGAAAGLWNGLLGKSPTGEPGPVQKAVRFTTRTVGKTARFPVDLAKWFASPWGTPWGGSAK